MKFYPTKYPGYFATETGEIWSNKWSRNPWKAMTPKIDKDGYLRVRISPSGKTVAIHTIICEIFWGPKPSGYEVRHLDGNPSNNFYQNLRWGTRAENARDKVLHGRSSRGEKNCKAKITYEIADSIRREYIRGVVRQIDLANKYGLHQTEISAIVRNKLWVRNAS